MKIITVLILLLSYPYTLANNINELGRSLANYEACSQVSLTLNDQKMFSYYKKMFNDINLGVLSLNTKDMHHVYGVWGDSEKILSKLNVTTMEGICLSRFDDLSRKMLNKIVTNKTSH
tara:strand:+ start:15147 stop:15500 length:354 start_codon:yes stop_codon:yes gene_type:complete